MGKKPIQGYRENFARLQVFGTIADFDTITKALGVKPYRTHRKKDRMTRVSPPYGYDAWIFKAPVPRNRALEHHLRWLHRRFIKKTRYLKRLTRIHDVHLYCSYHSNYDQGRLELPPEVLAWCGEVGIPIHISILVQE